MEDIIYFLLVVGGPLVMIMLGINKKKPLLVLGGILIYVVLIAFAVGTTNIGPSYKDSNRDAILNDLNNLAASAYHHKIRPATMDGGGGAYDTSLGGKMWVIPTSMVDNENATYKILFIDGKKVVLRGNSKAVVNSYIEAAVDSMGKPYDFNYGGEFE
jgi:hypothetical protein